MYKNVNKTEGKKFAKNVNHHEEKTDKLIFEIFILVSNQIDLQIVHQIRRITSRNDIEIMFGEPNRKIIIIGREENKKGASTLWSINKHNITYHNIFSFFF